MTSLLLRLTELDFLLERREFTEPQKRCIRFRLNKKVKEFAENELPILIEKGLLSGDGGVEPTTPAKFSERFGLASPSALQVYSPKASLDMAGSLPYS